MLKYNYKNFSIGDKEVCIPTPYFITVNEFNQESTKKFRDDFQKCLIRNQQLVPIFIDSFGGGASSVFAMIDIIRKSPVPVATIASGTAYSAGAFLLSAGTPGYRYASPLSSIMIHDAAGWAEGKTEDIQNTAERMNFVSEQIFSILDKNCNKSPGYFKKIIKSKRNLEYYLTPEESKDLGLIDHVGIPELVFSVDYKLEIGE